MKNHLLQIAESLRSEDLEITEKLNRIENPGEYSYCENCDKYIHEFDQVFRNEIALCPFCESNLEY